MRPVMIVDLESTADSVAGALVVAAVRDHLANGCAVNIVGPGVSPDLLRTASGIFITGSQAMLDTAPWAPELCKNIVLAAKVGVPVLGVCFAHQMLAVHFGGSLARFGALNVGVPRVKFSKSGPFEQEGVALIHTHRDYVAKPPPDMVVVGKGGFGGVAALAHQSLPIWTCQGHPEWGPAICRHEGAAWSQWHDQELATEEAKGILRRFGAMLAKA